MQYAGGFGYPVYPGAPMGVPVVSPFAGVYVPPLGFGSEAPPASAATEAPAGLGVGGYRPRVSKEEALARFKDTFPGVKLAGEGAETKDAAGLPVDSTPAPEPAGEAPIPADAPPAEEASSGTVFCGAGAPPPMGELGEPEGPSRPPVDAPSVEGLPAAACGGGAAAPAEELGEPGGPSGPPPPAPAASGGGAAAPSSGRTVVVKGDFKMLEGLEAIARVPRDEKKNKYFWTPGEATIMTGDEDIRYDFGARRYLRGDTKYHIDPDAMILIEVEVRDEPMDPRVREATLEFKTETAPWEHPRVIKFDLVSRTWSASTPPERVLDLKGDGRRVPFGLGYRHTREYFPDRRKLPEALVKAGLKNIRACPVFRKEIQKFTYRVVLSESGPPPEGPSRPPVDAPPVEGPETAAPAEELGEPEGPSRPPVDAPSVEGLPAAACGGGAAAPAEELGEPEGPSGPSPSGEASEAAASEFDSIICRMCRIFQGVKLAGEGTSKDAAGLPADSTAAPEPAGEAPTPEGPSGPSPSVEAGEAAASGGGAAAPSSGAGAAAGDGGGAPVSAELGNWLNAPFGTVDRPTPTRGAFVKVETPDGAKISVKLCPDGSVMGVGSLKVGSKITHFHRDRPPRLAHSPEGARLTVVGDLRQVRVGHRGLTRTDPVCHGFLNTRTNTVCHGFLNGRPLNGRPVVVVFVIFTELEGRPFPPRFLVVIESDGSVSYQPFAKYERDGPDAPGGKSPMAFTPTEYEFRGGAWTFDRAGERRQLLTDYLGW